MHAKYLTYVILSYIVFFTCIISYTFYTFKEWYKIRSNDKKEI